MANDTVVEDVVSKIGGVAAGGATGAFVAAPLILAAGAALTPLTLGLSLPIAGAVTLGGMWLGHKWTQKKEQKFVS